MSKNNSISSRQYTIMPLGDSITEGGGEFCCYRQILWQKLKAAGEPVEFAGSKSGSRFGGLPHEGYSGQPVEFIDENITMLYRQNPADIVLLHSGHNHFAEEQPVPGIIAATTSIIGKIRAINPEAIILLAQVITSGKLPKYSYIPELNMALAELAKQLTTPLSPVIPVDQAAGFDWRTDTVEDMVHPNASGAGKMAEKWFQAIHAAILLKKRTIKHKFEF